MWKVEVKIVQIQHKKGQSDESDDGQHQSNHPLEFVNT